MSDVAETGFLLCLQSSRKGRVVLREVLVTVRVKDGLSHVVDCQLLGVILTISVVFGAAVGPEVGRLVDKRSGPGVCTGDGGAPESRADVNLSEIGGN